MKKELLFNLSKNGTDEELMDCILENATNMQGIDGLYLEVDEIQLQVEFDNDDIKEFLNLEDVDNEELCSIYQLKEDEINTHFLKEQIDDLRSDIITQIKDLIGDIKGNCRYNGILTVIKLDSAEKLTDEEIIQVVEEETDLEDMFNVDSVGDWIVQYQSYIVLGVDGAGLTDEQILNLI